MGRDESTPPADRPVAKGDHYRHPEGTNEIVYAVEDDVVLTLREYRRRPDFERAVEGADYVGVHDGVASLPDVAAFDDPDG